MLRDIDYAAATVRRAIVEKFGRKNELTDLQVTAGDTAISVQHGPRSADGSRDWLLSVVRKADDYDELWQLLAGPEPSPG
jgi:hypothetical protein